MRVKTSNDTETTEMSGNYKKAFHFGDDFNLEFLAISVIFGI